MKSWEENYKSLLKKYYLLHENKNRFIDKNSNLTDEQKEEIKAFFNSHNTYENKIDWNKSSDLTYDDFKKVMDSAKESKTHQKKVQNSVGIKGLEEHLDYEFLGSGILDGEEWVAYMPLTWKGAKVIAGPAVPPVQPNKDSAAWCIGYSKTDTYWERYTRGEDIFVIICGRSIPTYKVCLEVKKNGMTILWDYYDNPDSVSFQDWFLKQIDSMVEKAIKIKKEVEERAKETEKQELLNRQQFLKSHTNFYPVGGTIFYVDTTSIGATYVFYDKYGQIIGTDSSKLSVIKDAVYYTVIGTPSKDKIYVMSKQQFNAGEGTIDKPYLSWSYFVDKDGKLISDGKATDYGGKQDNLSGVCLDASEASSDYRTGKYSNVGYGKANTKALREYDVNYFNKNMVKYYGDRYRTIWGVLDDYNEGKLCIQGITNNTGCNDWFVPSAGELWKAYEAGVTPLSTTWSSGILNSDIYSWLLINGKIFYLLRHYNVGLVPVRAF